VIFPQKLAKLVEFTLERKRNLQKIPIPIKHQLQSEIKHFKTITQNILNEEQHDKLSHPQPVNTV
jgi:hypothetical protein